MNTSHPTQYFYETFTGEEAALHELTLDALGTPYTRIDNHIDAEQKSIRFYVKEKNHHFEDMKVNIVDRCLKNKDLNSKFESRLAAYQKILL
jgi:hypothetical protein